MIKLKKLKILKNNNKSNKVRMSKIITNNNKKMSKKIHILCINLIVKSFIKS
jgi:hypothetical protein